MADLSDGAVEYCVDLYFDAAHLLRGEFEHGEVLLPTDRPGTNRATPNRTKPLPKTWRPAE